MMATPIVSDLLNGPRRSCRPDPGAAVPEGLQLSTGRLLLPARKMPYGTACLLVCPHCYHSGRGEEESTLVHVSHGRRCKDGTHSNNYLKHLVAPDNPTLPCYRKQYAAAGRSLCGGGGPESLVHALGSEFIAWRLDGKEGWEWDDSRSGGQYPGSSFRFDALLQRGGEFMSIEGEVTHRLEKEKVQYLKTLKWGVLVADMSHPDVREWLHPRLVAWDRITMSDNNEDPMPLAEEIYNYMALNSVFQPLENDYVVKYRNT